MDGKEDLREINAGEARDDRITEFPQAGGLLTRIASWQREGSTPCHRLDTDRGIGRAMRRRLRIGGLQALGQGGQCRLRGLMTMQGTTAVRPHGVPVRTVEEREAWIAPPLPAWDKDIPTAAVLLEPFQGTQGIGAPIHFGGTRRFDETTPRPRDPIERGGLPIGTALMFKLAAKGPGLQQGLPRLRPLKRDGAPQWGHHTPDTVVALDQCCVIGVVGRPRQACPLSASLQETRTGHARTGLGPYGPSLDGLLQQAHLMRVREAAVAGARWAAWRECLAMCRCLPRSGQRRSARRIVELQQRGGR
jgi:hypothetical protein